MTKIQRREERKILDYLREHDGFCSIFWVAENRLRAAAMVRLENCGKVVEMLPKPGFPTLRYAVEKP